MVADGALLTVRAHSPIVAVAPLPAVNVNRLPLRFAPSSTMPANAAAVPAGSSASEPPVAKMASRSFAVTSGAEPLSQFSSVEVKLSAPPPHHVSMFSHVLAGTGS